MATVCVQQVSDVGGYRCRFCVAVFVVPALSSVLQLVQRHTERGWFLPTGPVKSSVSLCDGSIHQI